MGGLHAGRLSLVQKALSENDHVAVSIFVNPIQFNKTSDLTAYPRTLKSDLRMLEEVMGLDDVVFTPENGEMYPEPIQTQYDFGELANVMEGEHRPGHFNGVGIVVNRLFRIVEPDSAYFGEKDFQQVAIIRRLIEIESLAVKIAPCPDGPEKCLKYFQNTAEYPEKNIIRSGYQFFIRGNQRKFE